MNQEKVIEIIFDELRKAEKKFPGWPNDPIHGATIVGEEAGELLKAALDYFRDIGMMQAILAALAERTDGPSEGEEEILCLHCGKPYGDSRHIRYGADLDNPIKHQFEPEVVIQGNPAPGKKKDDGEK